MAAQKKCELLAPAGGREQLLAALRFGADAVYGGMKSYGLRAYAGNFDTSELKWAVNAAHEAGKRFYVTMNILPFDRDMEGFCQAAREAESAGVDAAIVSDIGAGLMLRERLPGLALHISTQANITNTRAARHFCDVTGASRVILSREMSLPDIRAMRAGLPEEIELEGFVHGAMCVAYSGRCLLSRALTGRSANRGECAQPCRWQYSLMEEKRPGEYLPVFEDERGTYLYSAPDMCMLPHLEGLVSAGLFSLKIEGRMKNAYYVATVVSAYRRALDSLFLEGEAAYKAAVPDLMAELCKAGHREYTTGFYYGQPSPPSGACGPTQDMEYAADVLRGGGDALIRLKNRFYEGDRLELLSPRGVFPFTAGAITLTETGERVSTCSVAGTLLSTHLPAEAGAGDIIRGPNRNHNAK